MQTWGATHFKRSCRISYEAKEFGPKCNQIVLYGLNNEREYRICRYSGVKINPAAVAHISIASYTLKRYPSFFVQESLKVESKVSNAYIQQVFFK